MSIIRFELKKLFSSKLLLVMLAVITLLNVWLISRGITKEKIKEERELDSFLAVYEKDPEGMDEYIEKYSADYKIALGLNNPRQGIYATFPDSIYTDDDYYFFREKFIGVRDFGKTYAKTIKKSVRVANAHIEEYQYLGLSDNSFEIKYQKGVISSYERLAEIEMPVGNITGYDIYFDYSGFGVIAMVAMIIGGMLILVPEKTGGMISILRVSKRGRHETYLYKIAAAWVFCLLVCVLLTSSALITVGIKIGFSGFSYPIQMVDSFKLCPYMINVGTGVLFMFFIRFLACFTFLTVIIGLSAVFSGYVPAFLLGAIFTAANYLFANYNFLNTYDPMKNLNFFWSINGKEPVVYWRGIKLFGSCVPVMSSLYITYTALIVIFCVLGWFFFIRGGGIGFRKLALAFDKLGVKLRTFFAGISDKLFGKRRRRSSLSGFELRKLMTPLSLLAIVAVLLGTVYLSDKSYNVRESFEDKVYAEYMEEYGGEWTEEKDASLRALYKEYKATVSEYEIMTNGYFSGTVTSADYSNYMNKCGYAEKRIPVLEELLGVSDTLRALSEEGKAASFVNKSGWMKIYNNNFAYLYLAAIIIIFSNIYACEYKEGFWQIQGASRNGRGTVTRRKLIIACAIIMLLITVCEAHQYLIVGGKFGLDLPSAPLRSLSVFPDAGEISIAGHFVLIFVKQLFIGVAITLLTAVISKYTRKLLPTMAIISVVTFAPTIFGYFGFDFLDKISLVRLMGRA